MPSRREPESKVVGFVALSNNEAKVAERASFPLFDWLRFALASVVALTHEQVICWDQAGNLSVQVFFALSGWLIGSILLTTDRSRLPKFYYNRATRIWIPYALAVAFFYVVAALREGVDASWLRCLFFDGTFTHNWFINPVRPMPLAGTGNHFWSIAVEEQFYLAAPILIVLLPFGRSAAFWIIVAVVAVVSRSWYGSISLGVLAAVIRPKVNAWLLILGALTFTAAMLAIDYRTFAPAVALTIVLLTSRQGPRSGVGEFFGGVSYPLYLYHWTGMFAANAIGKRLAFTTGKGELAYLIAVLVGTAAYVLVDRKVMQLRGRYYSPTMGRSIMASAYALLFVGVCYGV